MRISKTLKSFLQDVVKDDAYWVERAKLEFATGIEKQRRRAGLSYKDVAERIHASAAYISKVFRGDSNLTIESMVKLARASGGCLEVRVVCESDVAHGWTADSLQRQQRRPLVADASDTVTACGDKVYWAAEHFFKKAEKAA